MASVVDDDIFIVVAGEAADVVLPETITKCVCHGIESKLTVHC